MLGAAQMPAPIVPDDSRRRSEAGGRGALTAAKAGAYVT